MVIRNLESEFIEIIRGSYNSVCLNQSVQDVKEKYGEPSEIVGDSISGFLHYGPLRFGYGTNELIYEIGFYFPSAPDEGIELNIGEEEKIVITQSTLLHEFIYLLNSLGIKWNSKGYDLPYGIQIIIEESNTLIKFDIYDGNIISIKQGQHT